MATQDIHHFFHPESGTISYVVSDTSTGEAIIIDPVANYDPHSGKVTFESANEIIGYIEENQLHVTAIMETHVHADHLTGAFYLSEKLSAPINVAEGVKDVYSEWKDELLLKELYEFEHFLLDHEHLEFGDSDLEVLTTPGHTPSDLTFKIGNAVFVGDALLHHGTGRADFPGGSAHKMFESISHLYEMDDKTDVYLCHDYPEDPHSLHHKTTIGEEKHENVYLTEETSEAQFVHLREERDSHLPPPKLLKPALIYNLTAHLPESDKRINN
ncbi:MBL fold metallo-hydrolase [Vibrio sp. TRT 17S01]|uniref:MBL fold metallo-hydrolase n=1 Tax=Vibrio sp. TRT 17S01 TaxID=3418505 RepID=UPI003CEDF791